jgi:hypothetical protein
MAQGNGRIGSRRALLDRSTLALRHLADRVAISNDGKHFASASWDKRVKVYPMQPPIE